ncbi:hypothetical protein KC342_g9749 [Hortaea werneckii]|nr:hypothetical protein KC342_g9749 [Hortaea werneckii]KAI7400736.1 hypothetical protein KC328_g3438 [Hortaea werneckii]
MGFALSVSPWADHVLRALGLQVDLPPSVVPSLLALAVIGIARIRSGLTKSPEQLLTEMVVKIREIEKGRTDQEETIKELNGANKRQCDEYNEQCQRKDKYHQSALEALQVKLQKAQEDLKSIEDDYRVTAVHGSTHPKVTLAEARWQEALKIRGPDDPITAKCREQYVKAQVQYRPGDSAKLSDDASQRAALPAVKPNQQIAPSPSQETVLSSSQHMAPSTSQQLVQSPVVLPWKPASDGQICPSGPMRVSERISVRLTERHLASTTDQFGYSGWSGVEGIAYDVSMMTGSDKKVGVKIEPLDNCNGSHECEVKVCTEQNGFPLSQCWTNPDHEQARTAS